MPTLNQARFIGAAIDSVFAQDLEALELVVQDGGSTDGTLELLAGLAARHGPRLRWESAPDTGPADAVNRAVARARGEWLGWLNSDDLYAPGAVARALAAFERNPGWDIVWGEGEHIDDDGAPLGRYPTRGPEWPLERWADGCPVCQPTVFMRRSAFQALGGLDATLRTAFDFDLWLRWLEERPGRAGFVAERQAYSRLHAGGITLRLREQVALEGMQVVHRHLGAAPAHWLLSLFDEEMAGLPLDDDAADEPPRLRLLRLVQAAEAWLSPSALASLRTHVSGHRALQIATRDLFAAVHGDGWADERLALRIRQPAPALSAVRICGRHVGPKGSALRLVARRKGQPDRHHEVPRPGAFAWALPLGDLPPGARGVWEVECPGPFVPSLGDSRSLSFILERLEGIRE